MRIFSHIDCDTLPMTGFTNSIGNCMVRRVSIIQAGFLVVVLGFTVRTHIEVLTWTGFVRAIMHPNISVANKIRVIVSNLKVVRQTISLNRTKV